jgi:hypothetical protein
MAIAARPKFVRVMPRLRDALALLMSLQYRKVIRVYSRPFAVDLQFAFICGRPLLAFIHREAGTPDVVRYKGEIKEQGRPKPPLSCKAISIALS